MKIDKIPVSTPWQITWIIISVVTPMILIDISASTKLNTGEIATVFGFLQFSFMLMIIVPYFRVGNTMRGIMVFVAVGLVYVFVFSRFWYGNVELIVTLPCRSGPIRNNMLGC